MPENKGQIDDKKDKEQRLGFLWVVSFAAVNLPAILLAEKCESAQVANIIQWFGFNIHLFIVAPLIILKMKVQKDKFYWIAYFSLFGFLSLFVFLFTVLPNFIQ
jgi:hypothetical protein